MIQLSHPYMTTGENVVLTSWIFVSKEISLLFNMLSRFSLQGASFNFKTADTVMILEPMKRKSVTASTFSPSICHEVKGPHARILVFFEC